MTLETLPFDSAELLDTPEAQAEYLALAFESGEAGTIAKALGTVARARGMTRLAAETGPTRQGLPALGDEGDPRLSTLLHVARALGLRLSVGPAGTPPGLPDGPVRP